MEVFEDDVFHSFLFNHLDGKTLEEKARLEKLEKERLEREAAEEAERLANLVLFRPAIWKYIVAAVSVGITAFDVFGLSSRQAVQFGVGLIQDDEKEIH